MRIPVPKYLGWKLGSLALAFLMWVVMSLGPEDVTTHVAPVIYQNLPPGYMIADTPPDAVRIELRGPASELTPTALDPLAVTVDLANTANPPERTLTVSTSDLHLSRGVTFLRAVPSQLQIRLARVASKVVRVTPRFAGEVPAGYRVESTRVFPQSLQISGTEGRVAGVKEVKTETIDLSQAIHNGEFHVNAFIDDPQVHFTASPAVTVKVLLKPIRN